MKHKGCLFSLWLLDSKHNHSIGHLSCQDISPIVNPGLNHYNEFIMETNPGCLFLHQYRLSFWAMLILYMLLFVACNPQQFEGKSCHKEKKEKSECFKNTNTYLMGQCNQNMKCMYENGYMLTVYFNCEILFEKVPEKCNSAQKNLL